MDKEDILFWLFAIVQGYMIYYIFAKLIEIDYLQIAQAYGQEIGTYMLADILKTSTLFGIPLVISIIGIQYLIYYKIKKRSKFEDFLLKEVFKMQKEEITKLKRKKEK